MILTSTCIYTHPLCITTFLHSLIDSPDFQGTRDTPGSKPCGHLSGMGCSSVALINKFFLTRDHELRESKFYMSHELLRVPNLGCGSDTPPLTLLKSATPSLWRRKSDTLSLWRRPEPTAPILIREISLWKIFRWRRDSMSMPALSIQWRSPSKQYPTIR